MALRVLATPSFARVAKKLPARDRKLVDKAVAEIVGDPAVGEEKRGDLAGVFVYKFKVNKHEVLLAYRLQPSKSKQQELVLLSLGAHENFYTEPKRM